MDSRGQRTPDDTKGLYGLRGSKHWGHPSPQKTTVRGAARPGGSSHKSARLAALTRRGVNASSHVSSRKGVITIHLKASPALPSVGGRGAVRVKQDRKAKKADDMSERNESKRRILAYLETHGRCTTAQVGKGIGMNSNGIHNIMRRLEAAGLIEIAGDDEAWRGGGFPPKLWRATGAQAPKREHKPGPSLVQRAVASQPALATVWMHKEAA